VLETTTDAIKNEKETEAMRLASKSDSGLVIASSSLSDAVASSIVTNDEYVAKIPKSDGEYMRVAIGVVTRLIICANIELLVKYDTFRRNSFLKNFASCSLTETIWPLAQETIAKGLNNSSTPKILVRSFDIPMKARINGKFISA
jgi:hypothetical protein